MSLCSKEHNKDSICLVIYQNPDQEISPNTLSSSETIVTVSLRTYTVRFIIVPRTVRFDTELYDIVPSVFDVVQYGTPCNQDYVLVTIPFHSYKD